MRGNDEKEMRNYSGGKAWIYNHPMRFRHTLSLCLLMVFLFGGFLPANEVNAAPAEQVSAFELILAMNTLRVSNGLPPLVEDPIINAVAQSTAQTMAANNM